LDSKRGEKVIVNGSVSVSDHPQIFSTSRGFRYGDGVFETIRVFNGTPFQLNYHKVRLLEGAKALKLKVEIDVVEGAIFEIIKLNAVSCGFVRVAVSRAGGERGYRPNSRLVDIIVESEEARPYEHLAPISMMISSYRRPPSSVLPHGVKLAQGVTNTLAGIEAIEAGFNDAILLTTDDFVGEATSSNIFWRVKDQFYTPSLECGIIDGVMRRTLIELILQKSGSKRVIENKFRLESLLQAEEAFLTNVIIGVQPIAKIYGKERWVTFSSSDSAEKIFCALVTELEKNQ
jgi:branched-chain amino acid aminotransferase